MKHCRAWNVRGKFQMHFRSHATARSSPSVEFEASSENGAENLRKDSTGLYGYEILRTAKGFRSFAQMAIERSEELIAHVKQLPPSMATIKAMDDISNAICQVVDAAELCRNTHPDKEYVNEANQASMKLYNYLHYLNTNRCLYDAVVDAERSNVLTTDEARRTAKALRIDFERGGVHLDPDKMTRINERNMEITRLGREFTENMINIQGHVDIFPASKIPESYRHLLHPSYASSEGPLKKIGTDGLRIITDNAVVSSVLKWIPNAEVRKQVYIAGHSTPKENLRVLDKLIDARHEVAELVGYSSYAEFAAAPTMAGSSEVVRSFLLDLISETHSKAKEERETLHRFSNLKTFEPWDEAYYTGLFKARQQKLDAKVIASYFPLDQCMVGLKVIVKSLFDATFEQVPTANGEAWHPDVQKWKLRHPSEGVLGHMFLDLYSRKGKYPSCAHFTLKGGRRESENEYQLPVVALVCNFSKPTSAAPLLQHWEVENLFHEFGHALHSLLSRTDYQHFSGTRTVIDFAETPSNLFEFYAWDYRVLKTFARDYSTGEVIPEKMVNSMNQAKKMLGVTELLRQVLYALADQTIFGPQPLPAGGTTAVVKKLQEECGIGRHVEGTHWQTRFGHLITYGAGYYSYLYAKSISASIWRRVCLEDPLSLNAGEVIRKGILQYGGAKEAGVIVRECLGDEALIAASTGGVRPSVNQLLRDLGVYDHNSP